MTREEAIKILRREIECLSHTKCEDCILEAACDPIKTTPYDSEYIEVYEMAISALSENNGDLISRQAVLDKFSDYVGGGMSMNDFDALWDIVEKIPSIENKGESEEGGKT